MIKAIGSNVLLHLLAFKKFLILNMFGLLFIAWMFLL